MLKIILLISEEKIKSKLLFGRKPPDEIIDKEKLKASQDLKLTIFNNTKINIVIDT